MIGLVAVYPSLQMERQLPLVLMIMSMVLEQMQDTYVFIILTLLPTNGINLEMTLTGRQQVIVLVAVCPSLQMERQLPLVLI